MRNSILYLAVVTAVCCSPKKIEQPEVLPSDGVVIEEDTARAIPGKYTLTQDGLYQILPLIDAYFEYDEEEEKRSSYYESLAKKIENGELEYDSLSMEDQNSLDEINQDGGYWTINTSATVTWHEEYPYKKVEASSTLAPSGKVNYEISNIMDYDLRTVWSEGVSGNGIGEYVTVHYPARSKYNHQTRITDVTILNGFVKSNSLWQRNGRVKTLKVYINNNPYALLELEDSKGFQTFNLGRIISDSENDIIIKFELIDVYPGTKYEDVVISNLIFQGEGVN